MKNLYPLQKSWPDFAFIINQELGRLKKDSIIVEIGGGANPYLSKEQVENFHYIVIDVNKTELRKAKGSYFQKICTDITVDHKNIKCDLIITNMLLEHLSDPKTFHISCYNLLNTRGKAIHFFATKYSPASIINIIFPERISRQLLYALQKRKWSTEGKFPAYYKWCLGPTKKQINKFQSIGYIVEIYKGYLGSGYLSGIKYLRPIEILFNFFVLKLNHPLFCSNSIVTLSK